jgi:hypothetical protein
MKYKKNQFVVIRDGIDVSHLHQVFQEKYHELNPKIVMICEAGVKVKDCYKWLDEDSINEYNEDSIEYHTCPLSMWVKNEDIIEVVPEGQDHKEKVFKYIDQQIENLQDLIEREAFIKKNSN